MVSIVLAGVAHLEPLSQLLNAHRIEQGMPDNQPAVAHFLFERLINHEAVHFIALKANAEEHAQPQGLGFIQLYPSFSSESLMPYWTVGALYVTPSVRQEGLGKALIAQALQLVRERGDEGLRAQLSTRETEARQLMQSMGFQVQSGIETYHYLLTPSQQ